MSNAVAEQPATEIVRLDPKLEVIAQRLDDASSRYSLALADETLRPLRRTLMTANAIQILDAALTNEVMGYIMPLMNSPLGFMCDRPSQKNNAPYSVQEVKRCLIDGLLKGFFPVNNEMNIIAGKFYGAQQGWWRKLCEIPGISQIEVNPGFPALRDSVVGVRVSIRWKLKGAMQELRDQEGKPGRIFAVSQNSGSTTDNTQGKALRKAYKAAYEQITATYSIDDEPEEMLAAPLPIGRQNLRDNGNGQKQIAPPMQLEPVPPPATQQQDATALPAGASTTAVMEREPGIEDDEVPGEATAAFTRIHELIMRSTTPEQIQGAIGAIEQYGPQLGETLAIQLRQLANGKNEKLRKKGKGNA